MRKVQIWLPEYLSKVKREASECLTSGDVFQCLQANKAFHWQFEDQIADLVRLLPTPS